MDRTERFGLILSPAEKHTLARLAEVEGGLSQAAILRHLLRRAAREHGLWPPDVQYDGAQPHQRARVPKRSGQEGAQ
jgi:hypothetical protein